jgi:hypothetical protein
MDGWMVEWFEGWLDAEYMSGWMDRWINIFTYGWMWNG